MKKITDDDRIKICNDYLDGMSYLKITEKYKISSWSVWNTLNKNNIKSRVRKHECDETYFEVVDNGEKAYWLGLLFSDGYVRKRKQMNGKYKQGGVVGISLKSGDEYLLKNFIKDLKSTYNLREQIRDGFTSYKLEIYSVKMVNDLIKLGCVPKKSLILLPPTLNYDLIPDFIRGYFDGDGSIGRYNGRLKFTLLGTENMLKWILNYFKIQGLKSDPKIAKKNNIYSLQINKSSDIELIEKIMYTSSGNNYLIRKKQKFK